MDLLLRPPFTDVFDDFRFIEWAIRIARANVKALVAILGQKNWDFAWLNSNFANFVPMKGRITKGDVSRIKRLEVRVKPMIQMPLKSVSICHLQANVALR